ncbi:PGF-CTERM-anchored ABC transporter substrate-binding protein [Halobacteriales archaeon Cl-PHB]
MKTNRVAIAALVVVSVLGPATVAVGAQSDADCSFPVERTDATGTTVTIEEEPQRIVTLNPSAAQTMWEIGAEDKVVGVTQYTTYLEGASAKANISGAGGTVNVEKVVAQEPDLVLAPNATFSKDNIRKLRESGVTVYHFSEATSLEDIKEKTTRIGQLTGECQGATEAVERMDTELSRIDRAVEGQDRPDVLYVFFGQTAGEGTFIHMAIEAAGGNNVAADAGITGYKPISEEIVVDQNPDWIVLNSGAPTVPKSDAYNATTAVEQNQTVVVDRNRVSQPAPRIVSVVKNLAKSFHPDAYAAAETTATATSTPTPEGVTDTPTATVTHESTPGGIGPGFGVATALVALLGAVLLARRAQ